MAKKTEVSMLRKGGRGLAGTYENIGHHAIKVKPYVDALAPLAKQFGYKRWRQGVNIHVFVADDDTQYVLRPTYDMVDGKRDYNGLSLGLRVARGHEIQLVQYTSPQHTPNLINMMYALAKAKRFSINGCKDAD
jgi:hypothetical protein